MKGDNDNLPRLDKQLSKVLLNHNPLSGTLRVV